MNASGNERRVDDQNEDSRINDLVVTVAVLKLQMAENTAVTVQVRDILASFKMIASIAKWITIVSAAVAAIYHGFDFLRGK